jgi:hypothetical protein
VHQTNRKRPLSRCRPFARSAIHGRGLGAVDAMVRLPLLALVVLGGCIIVPPGARRPYPGPPPPPPGQDRSMNDPDQEETPQQPPPAPDDDPPPRSGHSPGSGPARRPPPPQHAGQNPFPDLGPQLTDEQLDAIPSYDRRMQYTYGAMVREGYSSEPHTMAFRCGEPKCEGSPSGHGWVNAGWY